MNHTFDENQYQQDTQAEPTYQQEERSNPAVRILIYLGVLAVVNVVLIALDAPFYIY